MARAPLAPRPISPRGFAALRTEYDALFGSERPKLVETIAWAAANGDRSENGDYIYGRKRLREVDRRIDHLSRLMTAAQVVDPAAQADRSHVYFGATVLIVPLDDDGDDAWRRVTLVGDDEADATDSRISWNSPLARALRGAAVGNVREVILPGGSRAYEVMTIEYPD